MNTGRTNKKSISTWSQDLTLSSVHFLAMTDVTSASHSRRRAVRRNLIKKRPKTKTSFPLVHNNYPSATYHSASVRFFRSLIAHTAKSSLRRHASNRRRVLCSVVRARRGIIVAVSSISPTPRHHHQPSPCASLRANLQRSSWPSVTSG